MSEIVQTQQAQRGGCREALIWVLAGVLVLALLGAIGWNIGSDMGLFDTVYTRAMATPAVTVQALPTDAPRAPAQQEQATPIPAPPTPLPVGQAPAVQVQPVAPAERVEPAPISSDAPTTIKTRAPVCFGGWWFVEGQNTGISCSGTGGD